MIRLLIADDHAVVRTGLRQLAATFDDVELVGAAANGEEAVALCADQRPDVVLMDLEMPVLDGIEATRRIVEGHPGVAVVVLTSFSDRERILRALDAGAVGYLLKDAEPEELARAVRAAARGEAPLDPRAGRALLSARGTGSPLDGLSEREREVLTLVARGLPNKLIARELSISEKTVKAHLTSVYRAIGVTDRTQAALWAERNGLRGEDRSPIARAFRPRQHRFMSNGGLRALGLLAAVALVALATPIAAGADDDDGSSSQAESRIELSCSANSRVRLRVRTEDDDMLRIDLDLRTPRRGASWLVAMIHERRLVFRVPRRTGGSSGSLTLRRVIPDWPGPDTVTVRATGPRGEVCRATTTIDGD